MKSINSLRLTLYCVSIVNYEKIILIEQFIYFKLFWLFLNFQKAIINSLMVSEYKPYTPLLIRCYKIHRCGMYTTIYGPEDDNININFCN